MSSLIFRRAGGWLIIALLAVYFLACLTIVKPLTPRAFPASPVGTPHITVAWVTRNPGPAAQSSPQTAYDPWRDQLLLVWEDGRHDPTGVVDYYGLEYNSDIYARRYDARTGQALATEIAIATDGEFPPGSGRYDNEQRPAVLFDPDDDRYIISWQTFPDSVLESGDLHVTTCNDINLRSFRPADESLGPIIEDLAWYTAPPNLISPWGVYYDWSCQQDPTMTLIAPRTPLVLWHDHRERYEQGPDGVMLAKDIYAQWLVNDERQIEESFLITRKDDQGNIRQPRYQEHVDLAGVGNERLVVWEDERRSAFISSHGFREIFGRFIAFEGNVLQAGKEFVIASGQEGTGADDYRLLAPQVGFLAEAGLYVVVWSRAMHYSSPQDVNYTLMMAMFDLEGSLVQGPTLLADTTAHRPQVHDLACVGGVCVLIFRNRDLQLYARLITSQGDVSNPIRIDASPGGYGYAHLQVGSIQNGVASFFASYVVGNEVHLARLDVEIPSSPTPTPYPTPTSTPSPCADAYEPDDSLLHASPFTEAEHAQRRSFDHPGDVDYVRFMATAGETWIFATRNLALNVDTTLTLIGSDGTPMIFNDDDPFTSPASRILWRPTQTGEYFLKIAQADTRGACYMSYTLTIERIPSFSQNVSIFLPMLFSEE